MSPASKGLTQRDTDALDRDSCVLRAVRDGKGGARTNDLRKLAGDMPLGTWQRGVASLVMRRLLSAESVSMGRFDVTVYQLTEAGSVAARDLPALPVGWSWVGQRVGRGLALSSSPKSSTLQEEQSKKKKKDTNPLTSGLVSGLVDALDPVLVAQVAAALGPLVAAATAALNRYAATPMPPVLKCGCGRTLIPAFSTRTGNFDRCPSWQRCTFWKSRNKPAEATPDRAQAARLGAATRSVSERKGA